MEQDSGGRVVPVNNLTEYFRDELHSALAHQKASLDDHTAHYVVNLLTVFASAEQLHAGQPKGQRWAPLALMLAQAREAPTAAEREYLLQRMGDVSLFMAGFFSHGFAQRLVDVDYFIAMGGRAYATLAGSPAQGPKRVLTRVFDELSSKFQLLVDALGEISDSARVFDQRDVLRLYEIWLKTGSNRARQLLGGLGITPTPVALRSH